MRAWFVLGFCLAGGGFTRLALGQEMELPEFVLESQLPQFLETKTGTTVIRITSKESGKSLPELLQQVPGLQVRSEGPGQKQTLSIRAANGKQIAVIVDGVPLGDPRGGSVDLSQIPIEMVERIEVYRGGRGALAGEGSLGGAVVIRLKRSTTPRGRVLVGGGSLGTAQLEALASSNGLSASYSMLRSNGQFNYVDTNRQERTRQNNASLQNRLVLAWEQQVWTGGQLNVLAWGGWNHRGSPGLEQFPSEAGKEAQHTYVVSTRLEQSGLGGIPELNLTGSASWAAFRWQFQDPKPYFPPPSDTDSLSQRAEAESTVRYIPLPNVELKLGLGLRHEWSDVERLKRATLFGEDSWQRSTVHGTFGSAWTPFQSWTNTLVLRSAYTTNSDWIWMPSLESSWSLTENLGLAVSGSRAWRQPQFDELYFEGSGIRGNPDLSPEDAWGVDVSAWFELPWLRLETSLFWQKIQDSILFLPKTPYVIQAQNADEVTSYGAEVQGHLEWSWFSLGTGLTWLHARLGKDEAVLPLKPSWQGFVSPRVTWGPVSASATVRGQGFFYLDRFEGRKEEGRWLLDAQVGCSLGWGYMLAIQGRNLTNKQDSLDAFQYPLPGISFFVNVSKEFGSENE